jgi:hypothetical protein
MLSGRLKAAKDVILVGETHRAGVKEREEIWAGGVVWGVGE